MPAQGLLHGFVDDSHAAATYFSQDPIFAELLGNLADVKNLGEYIGRSFFSRPMFFHHHQGWK